MRVLLATAEYPPAACGGIGIFYRDLGRALANLGAEVHVLAPSPRGETGSRQQQDGVVVHREAAAGRPLRLRIGGWRFDSGPVSRARAFSAAARRLAREIRPDVVETHDWAAPLWSPPARPFLVRLHGSSSLLAEAAGKPPPRLMRALERRSLLQADRVVAVSQWARRRSAEVFRLEPEGVDVVPNGVDTERFAPGPEGRREEIVFAGTLREGKGLIELLEALETVLRLRPNACATLAGGPDRWHDLPPRIRSLVERVRMTAPNRLLLTGRIGQDELARLYRRAAVCAFPSHVETFGLACAEAMSCGAAVVAGASAAAEEIVEQGRSGLLVDPRDPQALAEVLLRVLLDAELQHALGVEARLRVVEQFSIGLTAKRTLALYERALRHKEPWRGACAA